MRSPKRHRITKEESVENSFESIDHRNNSTKLWRTIKGIDGKSKKTAENEGITFTGRPHTSPKLIANSFNRQFTTSKQGKHSSSRRTRHVSKDVKRMSLEELESFTSAIKSCRSSRAYGPDSLSIFHLKNLGPLATEHLTALYNNSLTSCRLPSIISHPDSQARQRPITRHLLQTHIAAMPSCQGPQGAHVVVVIDLPLLRVAVEGSDNPVSLEKPCQASLPPDQQGRHSLGRHPEVQYVA